PLKETQLEDLGLNTCNHDLPLSSRKVPSFDEPGPQPQPLPNCPPLDISLGSERGPEPPVKPLILDSFRMKVVDPLTIHTPPSPHLASFHPKDTYCYYHPRSDDPKKHYGFKPGRGLNSPVRLKEVEKWLEDGVACIKQSCRDLSSGRRQFLSVFGHLSPFLMEKGCLGRLEKEQVHGNYEAAGVVGQVQYQAILILLNICL
ncbi:hypothetical protein Tco_0514161, partial [Tanacetum coccineum]